MASYSLSGSGQQSLTPGTAFLQITVTALGSGYSTGIAVPTNYYHLGEFRLGSGGFFYPTIPLDATAQLIAVPAGVDTLGYVMRNTQTVTVLEVPGPTVANATKQPWDRFVALVVQSSNVYVPPNTASTNTWSYTVPASQILRVTHLRVEATANGALSQGVTALCQISIGGNPALIASLVGATTYLVDEENMSSGPLDLPAGTVIAARYLNQDTARSVQCEARLIGYTFAA